MRAKRFMKSWTHYGWTKALARERRFTKRYQMRWVMNTTQQTHEPLKSVELCIGTFWNLKGVKNEMAHRR